MSRHVLVIGGAGYIGSHTVKELLRAGYNPIVLDDLSTGHERLVTKGVPFYRGRASDEALFNEIHKKHSISAVMHFAAKAFVGESVKDPFLYYERNVAETLSLLKIMISAGVKTFVFSSTCSTFGIPQTLPIHERLPQNPINPYGMSKLMVEHILRDGQKAYGLNAAVLRYFNAAGADPDGTIGEDHNPETHLIPNILRALTGQLSELTIYGNDYATPDGTCIRDYIHVSDLAQGHIAALEYLKQNPGYHDFNLGSGRGHSNLEVLAAVEKATSKPVPYVFGDRRPGDPPKLVADSAKAEQILRWSPKHDLESIVTTAWAWEQNRGAK